MQNLIPCLDVYVPKMTLAILKMPLSKSLAPSFTEVKLSLVCDISVTAMSGYFTRWLHIAVSSIGGHYVELHMFEPLILLSRKQKKKALITNCLSLGTEEYSKNVLPLKSEKMWNHRLDLNKGR